jgi:hypothetical protein
LVLNELTFCLIASYLVFKDQICTFPEAFSMFSSAAVLIYTIKNPTPCQQLFSIFLKNFFEVVKSLYLWAFLMIIDVYF